MTESYKIKSTYTQDRDEICKYCGHKQECHLVDYGTYEGERQEFRKPCEEEKYVIRKNAVKQGMINKLIITTIDIGSYIWSKIPFKKEFLLAVKFGKRIYLSVRAVIYLRKLKPKK